MAKKLRVSNPKEILFRFKEKGIPFFLEQTMFTKKITSRFGVMEFILRGSFIRPSDLGFIGVVKKHCEREAKRVWVNRKSIEYIHDGMKKDIHYKKDIYEIDLTGAYWNFAFQEKFITEIIYERGLTVPKKVRLIALGNLAKRTLELNFDGKNYVSNRFRRSEITESVFFRVSELTDMLMKKLIVIANNDFLFYWVDAIFVKGEKAKNEIIEYLNSEEIKHKCLLINDLIKKKNKIICRDDSHVNLKRDPENNKIINEYGERVFNFRKSEFINLIKK